MKRIRLASIILMVTSVAWGQDVILNPLPKLHPVEKPSHRFFDKTNVAFIGVAVAAQTLDGITTRHVQDTIIAQGCNDPKYVVGWCNMPRFKARCKVVGNICYMPLADEGDPLARPFESAGWGGTIALHYGINIGLPLLTSYELHRHGHHKLERLIWLVPVSFGLSGGLPNLSIRIPR